MRSLTLVIPAYNEEARIPSTLEAISAYLRRGGYAFSEVIVVDDGSVDGTTGVVESYTKSFDNLRLIRNPGNRGKGYAVRNGMLQARGEWILFTDADLSTPITELDRVFEVVDRERAVIAIGSRALDRKLVRVRQPALREYSGRIFNLAMRLITGLPFADTQCGFKLYRADAARMVFRNQILDGFSFDVEDLVLAKHFGFRTIEVPVEWANAEGTKVSTLQGLKSFADLLLIRWYVFTGRYKRDLS